MNHFGRAIGRAGVATGALGLVITGLVATGMASAQGEEKAPRPQSSLIDAPLGEVPETLEVATGDPSTTLGADGTSENLQGQAGTEEQNPGGLQQQGPQVDSGEGKDEKPLRTTHYTWLALDQVDEGASNRAIYTGSKITMKVQTTGAIDVAVKLTGATVEDGENITVTDGGFTAHSPGLYVTAQLTVTAGKGKKVTAEIDFEAEATAAETVCGPHYSCSHELESSGQPYTVESTLSPTEPVTPGDSIVYTLTAKKLRTLSSSLDASVDLSALAEIATLEATPTAALNTETNTLSLSAWPATGDTASAQVRATVRDDAAAGTYGLSATAGNGTCEQSCDTSITVQPKAGTHDLTLSQVSEGERALSGQEVRYALNIARKADTEGSFAVNTVIDLKDAVTVADFNEDAVEYPDGFNGVFDTAAKTLTVAGTVADGKDDVRIELPLTVKAGLNPITSKELTVAISNNGPDGSCEESCSVTTAVQWTPAVVTVEGPEQVKAGENLQYTVTVENLSGDRLSAGVLTSNIGSLDGLEWSEEHAPEATAGVIRVVDEGFEFSFDVDNPLEAGQTATITGEVPVKTDAAPGVREHTLTVTGNYGDADVSQVINSSITAASQLSVATEVLPSENQGPVDPNNSDHAAQSVEDGAQPQDPNGQGASSEGSGTDGSTHGGSGVGSEGDGSELGVENPDLADTGAMGAGWVWGALILLALGGGVMFLGRRRRQGLCSSGEV